MSYFLSQLPPLHCFKTKILSLELDGILNELKLLNKLNDQLTAKIF